MDEEIFPISVKMPKFPPQKALGAPPKKVEKIPESCSPSGKLAN